MADKTPERIAKLMDELQDDKLCGCYADGSSAENYVSFRCLTCRAADALEELSAALSRVRSEALEEAAKVAERDQAISKATEANYEPGSDSWWLEHSDAMTAKRIAAAIRALAAPARKDTADD